VQELVAEGAITRDEARTHPRRNIVTRALGIEPTVRVDSWNMPIIRGDRFVICSVGDVDEVADPDITAILLQHSDDPQAAADALVGAANGAGGRDNITVVIVDVLEGDDPPDPTEEFDVVPLWSDEVEPTGETQIVSDPPDDPDLDSDGDATGTDEPIGPPRLYDGGDDVEPVPGAVTPTLDLEASDAVDTSSDDASSGPRRGGRLVRFLLGLGVAAVVVLGFAILSAWARDGYFVAFDDAGSVVIYQGRSDGVLWFDPTVEAFGQYSREDLDDESVALVEAEPHFETQASAERFVAERLSTTTTSTTTTTTTTVAGTTTATPSTAPTDTTAPSGQPPSATTTSP
jgi:hypothetical protein